MSNDTLIQNKFIPELPKTTISNPKITDNKFKRWLVLAGFLLVLIASVFGGFLIGAKQNLEVGKNSNDQNSNNKNLQSDKKSQPNTQEYFAELYGTDKYFDCNSLLDNSDWWNVYRSPRGIFIRYPLCFNLFEYDARIFGIEMKNFWIKPAHSFPYVNYYNDQEFFLETKEVFNDNKLPLSDWLSSSATNMGSLSKDISVADTIEKAQITNENRWLTGNLINQSEITIGSKTAIQRQILYKGEKGEITITYTYVPLNETTIIQLINHASNKYGQEMYKRILDTIRFHN